MKDFILCVTVLWIPYVNGALRPLDLFDDAASEHDYSRYSSGIPLNQELISGRLSNASATFHFIRDNRAQFQKGANSLSDASIEALWGDCGSGNELLPADLDRCLPTVMAWGYEGAREATEKYISIILRKFWEQIDWDLNGSLDYEEFRNLIAVLVNADARIIMDFFNTNDPEELELTGAELYYWKNTMVEIWGRAASCPTDEQYAAMTAAYLLAQNDGDPNTMTLIEIGKFIVQQWAILAN